MCYGSEPAPRRETIQNFATISNGLPDFSQRGAIKTGAVRKCKASSNATEEEITKHANHWCNLATDREGGRWKRYRSSTARQTTEG
ncbi:hypothetical protein AOLI_G00017950 [Acnodon oligacanthus]